jgi:hypothetical protein
MYGKSHHGIGINSGERSSFHRGIASDYENLQPLEETEELKKRLLALNDQVSAVLKSTTALPFENALKHARLNTK